MEPRRSIERRSIPRRERPKLRYMPPEWRTKDPDKWIKWKHANKKLETETVYWITSSSKTGKPHAAPVWGIWKNNHLYFETDPKSPKGRNLASNPQIVFHTQDGSDTVIVRGTAKREKNPATLRSLKSMYTRKYDYTPNWSNPKNQIVFNVTPRIAHAWRAPRMHRNLANFIF